MNDLKQDQTTLDLATICSLSWPTEGIYVASLEIDRDEIATTNANDSSEIADAS